MPTQPSSHERLSGDALSSLVLSLNRPHPALWTYYVISAFLTGPGVVVALPYLYFRYHTLRYRFDEEGIHMQVGILFRREINLTYARVQDIHLRSNFIQRWLGLANVQIQTASGSAGAEMVIEGFKEYEAIRDFLYARMRGTFGRPVAAPGPGRSAGSATPAPAIAPSAHAMAALPSADPGNETVSLLRDIGRELRRTRELLESGPSAVAEVPPPSSPPGRV